MFRQRTLQFLFASIAMLALLLLPAAWWPGYLDSPIGTIVAIPYLSIYLFHKIGIPGLLQNHGLCGWGWCAPTVFGWVFLCIVWLFIVWLLAWAAASLTGHENRGASKDDSQLR
jgi:hypothetical protein